MSLVPIKINPENGAHYFDTSELYTVVKRIIVHGKGIKKPLRETLKTIAADAAQLQDIAVKEGVQGARFRVNEQQDPMSELKSFLIMLGALYQLGRRPHDLSEAYARSKVPWLTGGGVYQLKNLINQTLENVGHQEGNLADKNMAELAEMQLRYSQHERSYELLRDLARWMATGAFALARTLKPIRALIIDDSLHTETGKRFRNQLTMLYNALKSRGISVSIDYLSDYSKLDQYLSTREINLQQLPIERLTSLDPNQHDLGRGGKGQNLFDYNLLLTEVEFRGQRVGPEIVRRLSTYLDEIENPKTRPVIVAISRKDNIGFIQQCLTLGAEAYISKERFYQLPARVTKVRFRRTPVERRGGKSNFRSLYQLLPSYLVKLQREDQLITGANWDSIDRKWLDVLPKADLHTHIGTCISLPTIEALALNTCGYIFGDRASSVGTQTTDGSNREIGNVRHRIQLICKTVICAGILNRHWRASENSHERQYHPAYALRTAAAYVLHLDKNTEVDFTEKLSYRGNRSPYHDVIKWLKPQDGSLAEFEVCSLLVAFICMFGGAIEMTTSKSISERVSHQWDYFGELDRWTKLSSPKWSAILLDTTALLCQKITGPAWHRGLTSRAVHKTFRPIDKRINPWQECSSQVQERIKNSVAELKILVREAIDGLYEDLNQLPNQDEKLLVHLKTAISTPREYKWQLPETVFSPLTLAAFVRIPTPEDANRHEKGLLRYLWGANLLGAEHLQYPENLILAAHDVVKQSVEQNIVYTELRCATNGYAAGGMNALGATDLLCEGFNMAIAYYALMKRKRWVRVNLLLGAKRHKGLEEFQSTISLLTYYLQRRRTVDIDYEARLAHSPTGQIPQWWQPCQVVGFDLSGDEEKSINEAETFMLPLFTYSAPITIHAGEANTAESIWEAVYRLRARRIGHGLHLRDNSTLMEYCITEGLCMEMCPTSNQFTNDFQPPMGRDKYEGLQREHYPLRYYIQRGLDVCVNTDNRQLHTGSTLTDEYLCAARLSGGLTKWEILRLVKAGFKHAFLRKEEIEMLLETVEDEVYQIVARDK